MTNKAYTPTPVRAVKHPCDYPTCKSLSHDTNTDHGFIIVVGEKTVVGRFNRWEDADFYAAAVNSYAKHAIDPIAAAEGDLLGQALDTVEILLQLLCDKTLIPNSARAVVKARAVLAQRKVQS